MPRTTNPWVIAGIVTIPATLEYSQLSIAGVGTRYIVGDLGGSPANGFWISSAYMATVAVMLPMSAWFADRMGRKRFLLTCLAGFAIASLMCGLATNLYTVIALRFVQGVFAGGLYPSAQAAILDAFPAKKQAMPLAFFATCTLGGLFIAPLLGGWLTNTYSWRWTFLIAVPIAAVSALGVALFVEDPPALKAHRAALLARPIRFDFTALVFIAVGLASLQILVGKGQEWDWLGDPFYRTHAVLLLAIVGIGLAVRREWGRTDPLIDLRPLCDRHFAVCGIMIFFGLALLYCSLGSLSTLLMSLFGYDAVLAGRASAPAGVAAIPILLVALWLIRRGLDARLLVVPGAVIVSVGCFWMSLQNLSISPEQVSLPLIVLVAGLVLILVPLMSVAYQGLPPEQRASASGLFSFLRFTGGTIGASLGAMFLERREQFHTQRLGEGWDAMNPKLQEAHGTLSAGFMRETGDRAQADAMAWGVLNNLRDAQAESLAAFDVFWAAGWVAASLLLLVLFMRPPIRATER